MILYKKINAKNDCPAPDSSDSPVVVKAVFSGSSRATAGSSCCEYRKKAFTTRAKANGWMRHKKMTF
jgi:hypothetical protein